MCLKDRGNSALNAGQGGDRNCMENQEMVCYCSGVTKVQIIEALDNGAKNLADIKRMTGACTIGRCKELNPSGT